MPNDTDPKVTMTKSRIRPRRSFGGSQGVWWKNKRSTTTTSNDTTPSTTTSTTESDWIGWDDELCRPIYPRISNEHGIVSDDCSKEATDEDNDKEEDARPPAEAVVPVKRKKSFGGRGRTRLSFSFIEAKEEDSTTINPLFSTKLQEGEREMSRLNQVGLDHASEIDNCKRRKRRRKGLDEDQSILKAKEYFQTLDTSHKLKLDSSKSPLSSSKVTRTSRKVDLTSPRINREYSAYAKASRDSGISPITVKEYAGSRGEVFRSKELFDGFFDDL